MANATPTDPKDQFSQRMGKGLGVLHRSVTKPRSGDVALWGNTGNEIINAGNFVTHNLDFHMVLDSAATTWTVTDIGGAAGAFGMIATDSVGGLALLTVGGATVSHGVQIQENVVATAHSQMYDPTLSHVVAWEARGSMTFALDSDWFVGIGSTEAPFMSVAGVPAGDDYMGFLHIEDATTVQLVQTGTAVANAISVTPSRDLWTPADASITKRSLGIRVDTLNEKLYWYLDGAMVGHINVGDDDAAGTTCVGFGAAMGSTICIINNSAGGANTSTATIDYINSQVTRYG